MPNSRALVIAAAGLACLLCPSAAERASAAQAPRPVRGALAAGGLSRLPGAARGPVSAALGEDEPGYGVVGLVARNPAQGLTARFGRTAVAIAAGSARFSLALAAAGRGARLRRFEPLAPRLSASNRVSYRDGALQEWWANGPLGLEQGFELSRRPAGTGPLSFALALSLPARLSGGSLLLPGGLRYTGIEATDASGRPLRAWLALRGGRVLLRVDDRGARYPLRVDPFVQKAELTASDGANVDKLGYSVAISGTTIVAGAPGHTVAGKALEGAVYVFTMPSGGWANGEQVAELTASDGASGDSLGHSVAISGNTIVAGAPDHKVGSNADQGAAYVFVMPAGGWATATQTAELSASDGAANDTLGTSVGISGSAIVAGAPNHPVGSNAFEGAAYVFVMPAGGWATATQTVELSASDGAADDQFGESVAISGSAVVTGAPDHKDGSNSDEGAAYVFVMPQAGWASATQTAELTEAAGASGDELGYGVAISGTTIAAAAPGREIGGDPGEGAVEVFTMPASGWANTTQAAELTASNGVSGLELGESSVAVAGNLVVAGADDGTGVNGGLGVAYAWAMPSAGWASATQIAELSPADASTYDFFGSAVAASGDAVVVGGALGAGELGAAYVFMRSDPTVAITTPANGASYTLGRSVDSSYACAAPAGASVSSCAGPVASGAPLDTTSLGSHSFSVSVSDSEGASATVSVSYAVVAGPTAPKQPTTTRTSTTTTSPTTTKKKPAPVPAPLLGSLRESAASWRESGKPASGKPRSGKHAALPPIGTTFFYSLYGKASVEFSFRRALAGRSVGGRCLAESAANEHAKSCTRTLAAGSLTVAAPNGADELHFDGALSAHRRLAPGSYTVTVTPLGAGGVRSAPLSLDFTIVS